MQLTRVSASRTSLRGSGLGNEAIAWAKAYLCAQAFDLRLQEPAWTFSRYHLGQNFGQSRVRALSDAAIRRALPQVRITETRFLRTGERDYLSALRRIDQEIGFSHMKRLAVIHEGMWGGYLAIRDAKPFLIQQIYSAPGVVAQLTRLRLSSCDAFIIGVHIRKGDFDARSPRRGEFNKSIPLGWYRRVVTSLSQALSGQAVRFLVFSDAQAPALQLLLEMPGVEHITGSGPVEDLAAMAACDLLVCSVSSFSMLASFLSGRPYAWYSPQLQLAHDRLSLWGGQYGERNLCAPEAFGGDPRGTSMGRGVPVPNDGRLPGWAVDALISDAFRRRAAKDLLLYGVIPFEGA